VARHQADTDLEVLRCRFLAEFEHSARGRRIGGERLLHEDMEPLLDRVGEVGPTKRQRRREDRDVTRTETIHRLLVGVETDELPALRNVHLIGVSALETPVAVVEPIFEDIGHGNELERAASPDRQRVVGCAGAASAATDQSDVDGIAPASVQMRSDPRYQSGGRSNPAGVLQEIAT